VTWAPNTWRRLGPHNSFVTNIHDQPDQVGSGNGDMVIFDTNWRIGIGEGGPRFPMMIYDLLNNGWAGELS